VQTILVVYPFSSFDFPVALRVIRRGGRESRETKDTEEKLEGGEC
jgi:hypothetical protein